MPRSALFVLSMLMTAAPTVAQVNLTGIGYSQNFNSLVGGLPAGWSVHTSATASTVGNAGTFTSAATTWAAITALTDFRNVASDNIAFGASSVVQSGDTNRALGWRPLAAATDARAGAIMFTVADTTGFENFSLSAKVFTGSDGASTSQTYLLEFRVGNAGSFSPIATYLTPTTGATGFNTQTFTADSTTLAALNNQSQVVSFRLRGTATTGTSLDTVALDDFALTYSAVAVPEPAPYASVFGAAAILAGYLRRRKTPRAA